MAIPVPMRFGWLLQGVLLLAGLGLSFSVMSCPYAPSPCAPGHSKFFTLLPNFTYENIGGWLEVMGVFMGVQLLAAWNTASSLAGAPDREMGREDRIKGVVGGFVTLALATLAATTAVLNLTFGNATSYVIRESPVQPTILVVRAQSWETGILLLMVGLAMFMGCLAYWAYRKAAPGQRGVALWAPVWCTLMLWSSALLSPLDQPSAWFTALTLVLLLAASLSAVPRQGGQDESLKDPTS